MGTNDISEVLENFNPEEEKKKNPVLSIGCDIGTGFICLARSDSDEIKTIRNAYLSLDKDEIELSQLTDINYVESEDNIYIIGEDAFKLANLFNKQVCRPMEKGMISPKEINAIDILTLEIKNLLGDIKDKDVYCSYSVPASTIDEEGRSIIYHEKVFSKIFSTLGINNTSCNEAAAIVYSEAALEKFSACSLSFGAGLVNIALLWHGVEALKFSTSRSGDYIDKSVAESLNIVQNRVTSVKEKFLNLEEGFSKETDKKKRRILEALGYFYESLINYTIKNIIKQFEEKVELELDQPIPLIIGGGTSLPPGFINLFKSVISKYNLPFEVSEIRQAKNPLTCVAKGLLIKTISDIGNK
jgi:hypothetical protein